MGGGGSRAGGVPNFVGGVEQRLLFEQGAGHRQQAVGDGAQGAAVAVAALAQRSITAAAENVVLGCETRPMIERVREPLVAGITTHDDAVVFCALIPVEAQPRRVRMIPATIKATLTTTSPLTTPPKIAIDNRNPPIGVNAKTWPATAADIIVRILFHKK